MIRTSARFKRLVGNPPAFIEGKTYEAEILSGGRYVKIKNDMGSQHTYFKGSYFDRLEFERLWGVV